METEIRYFKERKQNSVFTTRSIFTILLRLLAIDFLLEAHDIQRKEKQYADPNLDPRTRAILEIIETEEDYVADLKIIVHVSLLFVVHHHQKRRTNFAILDTYGTTEKGRPLYQR